MPPLGTERPNIGVVVEVVVAVTAVDSDSTGLDNDDDDDDAADDDTPNVKPPFSAGAEVEADVRVGAEDGVCVGVDTGAALKIKGLDAVDAALVAIDVEAPKENFPVDAVEGFSLLTLLLLPNPVNG